MGKNEKGIALLATLMLGVIAVAIVGGFLYVLTRETTVSKQERFYTSALEAAKGVAFVIIEEIQNQSLKCGSVSCTDPSVTYPANINLNIQGKNYSEIGNFNISAQLISYRDTGIYKYYSVKVISTSNTGKTRAEISFVVQIE